MTSRVNIPILMYHSIEKMPKSVLMRSMHVPPNRFNFQMWLLKILGYKGLSIKEIKPFLDGEKQGKVVGITFDDGYKNNLKNAAPILRKYGFSATCYIVSDCIGSFNSWDFDKGLPKLPLMDKSDIQKWLESGMDIGAHSKSHIDLTQINQKDLIKEINSCKEDLEKLFDVEVTDFCFPYGRFNEFVCKQTEIAKFITATTMNRGKAQFDSSKFMLPRIPINHHTLPHLFLTKILTNYELGKK